MSDLEYVKELLRVAEQDRDSWAQACADLENERNEAGAKIRELNNEVALLKAGYKSLQNRNKELESLVEAYFDRLGN